jgi:hypothetical protein
MSCEQCHDEFASLQVVKRLLGSLQTIDAADEWATSLTTYAYAGSRPWWERKISLVHVQLVVDTIAGEPSLSPRGRRMVRALALSAVFVFLAASPFSVHEHTVPSVTGNIAANMGMPMPFWSGSTTTTSDFNNVQQTFVTHNLDLSATNPSAFHTTDFRQVSDVLHDSQQPFSNSSDFTLSVSGAK